MPFLFSLWGKAGGGKWPPRLEVSLLLICFACMKACPPRPFWLKPFLVQGGHCLCVVRLVSLVLFLCVPHKDEARCLAEDGRWQTVEVPGGCFEVIRGRRPKAERKGLVRPQPDRGAGRRPRRNGPPPSVPTSGNERRTQQEVLQAARARVAKLEAAISAVGESDPIFPTLQGSQTST